MPEPFKPINNHTKKPSPLYYGMVRTGPGPKDRHKVKLFTDLKVSQRELRKLQAEADAAMQDPDAARRRDHGTRPIADHIADYLLYLRRISKKGDHCRIAEFTLNRLVALAGWRRLSDITESGVERVLSEMLLKDGRPATVGYRNCFVKRAKAFTRWLVPERLASNPLAKLRRGSITNALRRRGRRDGTDAEIAGLLSRCNEHRKLALCLTVLAGLRRSEALSLTWADVRLTATVPFIHCRKEWTKNGKDADLPLHPELVTLLTSAGPGMPAMPVVPSVPEVETIQKYLEASGHQFIKDGLRLDHHALRHTFVSNLGRTGCSRATRKALARHSSGDVTDGYEHASIAEMYAAVCRLPSPFVLAPVQAVATGTDGKAVCGAPVEQAKCFSGHFVALPGTSASKSASKMLSSKISIFAGKNSEIAMTLDVKNERNGSRPSTQVD